MWKRPRRKRKRGRHANADLRCRPTDEHFFFLLFHPMATADSQIFLEEDNKKKERCIGDSAMQITLSSLYDRCLDPKENNKKLTLAKNAVPKVCWTAHQTKERMKNQSILYTNKRGEKKKKPNDLWRIPIVKTRDLFPDWKCPETSCEDTHATCTFPRHISLNLGGKWYTNNKVGVLSVKKMWFAEVGPLLIIITVACSVSKL